jgi:WD40 repeat protein
MHVTFSHDESRILTGSDNGQIRVWSAKDGTEQLAFQQNDATCYVAFSPDDAQILTASRNKMACVWTASTGRLKHLIETENWRAPTSFSSDGKYIFECATHATLVRDTETGSIICSHDNYRNWTPLPSGVSYSILNFSWICMSPDPLLPPRKLCWIPPQYRIPNTELWTPISFPSPTGDRVLLANTHGTVVLGFNV